MRPSWDTDAFFDLITRSADNRSKKINYVRLLYNIYCYLSVPI